MPVDASHRGQLVLRQLEAVQAPCGTLLLGFVRAGTTDLSREVGT